jgi:hypothetical protein
LPEVLGERDGLTSCALFFLDRPGPEGRAEPTGFAVGLTGDDSREGIGEFVVDGARLGRAFFVCCCGIEEVDDSRLGGLGVDDRDGFALDEAETDGESTESGVWLGVADVEADATVTLSSEGTMASCIGLRFGCLGGGGRKRGRLEGSSQR